MKRHTLAILVALLGFALGLGAVTMVRARHRMAAAVAAVGLAATTPGGLDPRFVYKVQLGEAPLRGPADALVTIVSFSDHQCAACRALDQSLAQLMAEDATVRLAWKDLPATAAAQQLARAARAAALQGRFWELHDRLMGGAAVDPATLAGAGVDAATWNGDMSNSQIDSLLAADAAQARQFNIGRAPAIFINGRYLADPTPARLRAQVAAARALAQQLVLDGTAADRVYAALMRGALPSAGEITLQAISNDVVDRWK
jgi:protein-disulfide isomerase